MTLKRGSRCSGLNRALHSMTFQRASFVLCAGREKIRLLLYDMVIDMLGSVRSARRDVAGHRKGDLYANNSD
jgi:hypothetical protein